MNSTTEAAWLFDVNALIALLSPDHIHHERMHAWFATNSSLGWATCPITENGVIRIMSQEVVSEGRIRPLQVVASLSATIEQHVKHHRFWPDDVSLTDESLFNIQYVMSPKSVTDAYLLGLAAKRKAKLVSFDRTLPWQAIRNGSSKLVEIPLLQ